MLKSVIVSVGGAPAGPRSARVQANTSAPLPPVSVSPPAPPLSVSLPMPPLPFRVSAFRVPMVVAPVLVSVALTERLNVPEKPQAG